MTAYKAYQENQVEGSGPLGLVLLTYEAMCKSLMHAQRAIEEGNLAAEADYTGRAMEAVVELTNSLNMEEGGEVAKNLAAIYAYMFKRLTEGMCGTSADHVKEVLRLAQTLRDGWQQLANEQKRAAPQVKAEEKRHHTSGHYDSVQMAGYAA